MYQGQRYRDSKEQYKPIAWLPPRQTPIIHSQLTISGSVCATIIHRNWKFISPERYVLTNLIHESGAFTV